MSIAVNTDLYAAAGARRRFISDLKGVAGAGVQALYMPAAGEGTTVVDGAVPSRVWTHGNTPVGRLSALGKGTALSFNGTSDYISTPDTTSLSFLTGGMSLFAVVKVTDTAAARTLFGKFNAAGLTEEYTWLVNASDFLVLTFSDQSAGPVRPNRTSDAAITQGSWVSLATACTNVAGGATVAAGITMYQNGALFASTGTENASFVAMEDLGDEADIGAQTAHTVQFAPMSLALLMVAATAFSASQIFQMNQLSKRFYGI